MQTRLLRTPGFRYAAGSALVFALCMLVLGLFGYYGVRNSMEEQLRDYVSAETNQLLGDYADQGLEELRHDIRERVQRATLPRLHYSIVNPQGNYIFDPLALPPADGWSRIHNATGPDGLLLAVTLQDGYRLGVAAGTDSIDEFSRAFRHILLLSIGGVLLASALAGAVTSRRFLARLERFAQTADSVAEGELSARIPITGVGDDFEQLGVTINRMLNRIEQLMDEVRYVSASIAHDLRTPLTRLRQQLEALADVQHGEANRQACAAALATLDDTLGIFSALLRIAELESGRLQLASEAVDVNALLGRLAEAYVPVAEDRGQRVVWTDNGPAAIRGDGALLNQMLVNLIENALQHNGAGVCVRIEAAQRDEGVEVAVADDGVGVPARQLTDIVKPFYRLEHSRSSAGNGLGLALARGIASRHGAHFLLEDARPGLRVRLLFPRG